MALRLLNFLPPLRAAFAPRFNFLDPGPLVDGDLELVPVQPRWADEVLESCRHPMTVRDAPQDARVSREDLERFLAAAPLGRDRGDAGKGRAPSYQFWMLLRDLHPPLRIAGGIGLRIGSTVTIEMYYGHLGYHVYPPARGRRYAERSCRLLLPLARRHGLRTLWVTCNPENWASRRTCERLGATLVEIVEVPQSDPLYARGDRQKCRYRIDL